MKKFFTKRNVLYLINAIYLILSIVACALSVNAVFGSETAEYGKEVGIVVLGYIGSQFSFTALTLIVYYLAIMAGALNSKYKEEVKDIKKDK